MATDETIAEVLKIVRETREMTIEERALNNSRFSQLATGLTDVKKEVSELRVDLNVKIDKVYEALSQDIQVFAGDLHHVERRVTRLEKKLLS